MKVPNTRLEAEHYEQLTSSIPYLLAGLESRTDGNKIKSVKLQQIGPSDFRVVVKAIGADDSGDPIHVVSFTNSGEPGTALLNAEIGYRENLVRWSLDRFAKSVSDHDASENGREPLSIDN